jgi:hypothetical protein
MMVHQPKPIISNKIALRFAIWYVAAGAWVNVLFRKPKINHVYRLLVGWQSDDAVPKLDVAV